MIESQDKPLVTIVLMTYNQEAYVSKAVRSVLTQTYEPLEVIISDDASKDNTWNIVQQEVESYQNGNNKVASVVLNRNDRNLGIMRHFEAIASLIHGVLFVLAAGDDISLPNRVEEIVNGWKNSGRVATVIIHDGIRIDPKGREIGFVGERSVLCPLGACMAYSSCILAEFASSAYKDCFEDHVLGRRGALIGEVLILKEKLVLYRVGTGVSSVLHSRREPEIRAAQGRMASFRQSLLDVEFLYKKGKLDKTEYQKLINEYQIRITEHERFLGLASGSRFIVRWLAYRDLYLKQRAWTSALLRWPYLLPKRIGNIVYWCYDRLRR